MPTKSNASFATLAPFGIVRVPGWSVETLDAFGSLALFDEANAISSDSTKWAAFEAAYGSVMAQERRALWCATAFDPRFMKGLAIANPALARRVESGSATRGEDKRSRRLETTLYRFLSRCVGRTEPFGAWCGASLLYFGNTTKVERREALRIITPDLASFRTILAAIGLRGDARGVSRYRINPTLGRSRPDGPWEYWLPPTERAPVYANVKPAPLLDEALERLAELGTFTLPEVEQSLGVDGGTLDAFFFEQLVASGIVVGGLALPSFYSDAFDALAQSEDALPRLAKTPWRKLRQDLEDVCKRVEDRYDQAHVSEIAALSDSARERVARLCRELNVDFTALPAVVLRMDSATHLRLTLGSDFVARIVAAAGTFDAQLTSTRLAVRCNQCALIGPEGVSLAGLSPERLAERTPHRQGTITSGLQPGPLGSILVKLVTNEHGDLDIAELGITDDAASGIGRFLPLFLRQDPSASARLTDWLRVAHDEFAPCQFAVVGEPHAPAPNAAAQPNLGFDQFSLWGARGDARSLAGARIVADCARGLIALRRDGRHYALGVLSAVNLAQHDPVMSLLMMSSLRFAGGLGDALPMALEGRLAAAELPAIARERGARRYVAWCRAVRRVWPAADTLQHVMVRRPDTTPLRVPPASPLAVAALLDGVAGAESDWLLDPIRTRPFVRDEAGHYEAELVLPFVRCEHAFSGMSSWPPSQRS